MTRAELYETLDDILEIPLGTIRGDETLESLENWDSLAVVNFIATVNGLFSVVLPAQQVKACASVSDLTGLVSAHLSD